MARSRIADLTNTPAAGSDVPYGCSYGQMKVGVGTANKDSEVTNNDCCTNYLGYTK